MPILDIDFEIAKEMYEVNVWGVIRTTQVFSDMVIAAEGTIVIIGSIAGVMPYVFGGPPAPPLLSLLILPPMSYLVPLCPVASFAHNCIRD